MASRPLEKFLTSYFGQFGFKWGMSGCKKGKNVRVRVKVRVSGRVRVRVRGLGLGG